MRDPNSSEHTFWAYKCRKCGGMIKASFCNINRDQLLKGATHLCSPEGHISETFAKDTDMLKSMLEDFMYVHIYNLDLTVVDTKKDEQPPWCTCKMNGVKCITDEMEFAFMKWTDLFDHLVKWYGEEKLYDEVDVIRTVGVDFPSSCNGCITMEKCKECREIGFAHKREDV